MAEGFKVNDNIKQIIAKLNGFFVDGTGWKVEDSGGTDNMTAAHDGTDLNFTSVNTTDVDFHGQATVQIYDSVGTDRILMAHTGVHGKVVQNSVDDNTIRFGAQGTSDASAGNFFNWNALTIATDATDQFALLRSNGIFFMTGNVNNCWAIFAGASSGTTLTAIASGSAFSLGTAGADPGIDLTLNVWKSSGLVLELDNEVNSGPFSFSLWQMTG